MLWKPEREAPWELARDPFALAGFFWKISEVLCEIGGFTLTVMSGSCLPLEAVVLWCIFWGLISLLWLVELWMPMTEFECDCLFWLIIFAFVLEMVLCFIVLLSLRWRI